MARRRRRSTYRSQGRSLPSRILRIVGAMLLVGVIGLAVAFYRPDLSLENLQQRYANADSRYLQVGPLTVHYRDVGPRDAPVLVLLHGANASLHTWQGWVDRLKDRYRIVSLDLPGYGLTGGYPDANAGDYHLDGYASFLQRFVEGLKLERFALAGNSLGGGVAWTYAARHPEHVTKLILVDALAYRQASPLALPQRIANIPVLGNLLLFVAPRETIAPMVRSVYGDPDKVDDALIDRYRDLLRRPGNRQAMLLRLREPDDFDSSALKKLSMPVLIIWGGKDSWIAPAAAFRLQQDIPQAELQMFSNAGHVPMEEIPNETADAVAAFLQKP